MLGICVVFVVSFSINFAKASLTFVSDNAISVRTIGGTLLVGWDVACAPPGTGMQTVKIE
jgi:hypothetical protein